MWYMLDLYFVELAQWRKSLGGMEASLLIPILCIILYGYEVSLPLSGVVDEDLYVTLALAIQGLRVPRAITPCLGPSGTSSVRSITFRC